MNFEITDLDEIRVVARFEDLIALVIDAVNTGGIVGFLPPLGYEIAYRYVFRMLSEVAMGEKYMWGILDGERVIGLVLLNLEERENGRHRGEVRNLMIHSDFRRQGLARKLMRLLEKDARRRGLTLLLLESRPGEPVEKLIHELNYIEMGRIPDFTRDTDENRYPTVVYYKHL